MMDALTNRAPAYLTGQARGTSVAPAQPWAALGAHAWRPRRCRTRRPGAEGRWAHPLTTVGPKELASLRPERAWEPPAQLRGRRLNSIVGAPHLHGARRRPELP